MIMLYGFRIKGVLKTDKTLNGMRVQAMHYLKKYQEINTIDVFTKEAYIGNVHYTNNVFIWSRSADGDIPDPHTVYVGGEQFYINPDGSPGKDILKPINPFWVARERRRR